MSEHAVLRTLAPFAALALVACPKSEPRPSDANVTPTGPSRVPGPGASSPAGAPAVLPSAFSERVAERNAMVARQVQSRDVSDERVLAVMRKVPRHAFVPGGARGDAYADRPLPIGDGQTISQPFIVAFMTQTARPEPSSRCLEIGTGSGYQAAILAELCKKTYSIEYLAPVAERGERNLRALGYGPDRVALRVGDGYVGWPEAAPFDVVVVTAAPDHVPEPLLDQLAVGGRLVIPVGPTSGAQELELWIRNREGRGESAFSKKRLMGVRFVPFLGDRAGTE